MITPGSAGGDDRLTIAYGYDRASNRTFAKRPEYAGDSQTYTYDDLHRLDAYERGKINSTDTGIEDYWQLASTDWTLGPTGNHDAVAEDGTSDYVTHTANKANEYTAREVKAVAKPLLMDEAFATNTASRWSKGSGSSDAFDINSTVTGRFVFTTVSQDTFGGNQEEEARAFAVIGEALGTPQVKVTLQFPSGTQTGQAGIIFGFKDDNDYWVKVFDIADNGVKVYHVVDGTKTLVTSATYEGTVTAATDLDIWALGRRKSLVWQEYTISDGYPSGKVGLYTTVANTQFDKFKVYERGHARDLAGRWDSYNPDVWIDATSDRMMIKAQRFTQRQATFLRGLRVDRFQITFAIRREDGSSSHGVGLIFNGQDQDDFDYLTLMHTNSKQAPHGFAIDDGQAITAVTETSTDANMPALTSSDVLWARITCDGTNVTVKCATSEAGLSSASDAYSSSAFDLTGGLIGFVPINGQVSVDNLEITADRDANGTYEVTEHKDAFTLDASGGADSQPTHDLAGNLTYDGVFKFTFDAWNRLVKVEKAYRDPDNGDAVTAGSISATNAYDGGWRRTKQVVQNSADLDMTYHYFYCRGWSIAEVRNGSDQPIQQFVWGTQYVDELLQVGMNDDPSDSTEGTGSQSLCESHFYALHDAQYSVMALLDVTGAVEERYDYTPYGRRLFFTPSANDSGGISPRRGSQPWQLAGAAGPYGLGTIGRQGLQHDGVAGLVYNRLRMQLLDRFMQRDPANYADGMNLYLYARSQPTGYVDPYGDLNFAIGPGVNARVFIPIPVLGGASIGVQVTYASRAVFNFGPFSCQWCDTLKITGLAGAGASVAVSGAAIVTISNTRIGNGFHWAVGVGGGAGAPPAQSSAFMDLDIRNQAVTFSYQAGAGAQAFLALRVSGACTGCGWLLPTRIARVTACWTAVVAAVQNAAASLINGGPYPSNNQNGFSVQIRAPRQESFSLDSVD